MNSQNLGTIRTFHAGRFTVIVEALEDYDADLSFDDTGEVMEKLESGELVSFAVCARVLLDGNEVASDYLGGCIYADIADFQDHRECGAANRKWRDEGKTAVCGSYFADMIKTAIHEARATIKGYQSIRVRA